MDRTKSSDSGFLRSIGGKINNRDISSNSSNLLVTDSKNLISAPISVVSSTYLAKKKNQANLRNIGSIKNKNYCNSDADLSAFAGSARNNNNNNSNFLQVDAETTNNQQLQNNSLSANNKNNLISNLNLNSNSKDNSASNLSETTVNNIEIMSINSTMPSTMKLPAFTGSSGGSRPWVSDEQAKRNRAKFEALKAQKNNNNNQLQTQNGIKINGANTDLLIQESLNNFTLGKPESIGSIPDNQSRKKSPTLKELSLSQQQNKGNRDNDNQNQNIFFETNLLTTNNNNHNNLVKNSRSSVSSQLLEDLQNENTSKEFSQDLMGALDQAMVFASPVSNQTTISPSNNGKNNNTNNNNPVLDKNNPFFQETEKCEIPVPQPRKNWVQFD